MYLICLRYQTSLIQKVDEEDGDNGDYIDGDDDGYGDELDDDSECVALHGWVRSCCCSLMP